MEWVLRSPQIHSIFGSLGFEQADGYQVDENCNAALETILFSILQEDKTMLTFRRNVSFGQNVKKDLIPLLIHAKDDKTVELAIKVLVNLTIPAECLLPIDTMLRTDFGRHMVFEIKNLLIATKLAFADQRTTKVVIDYLKKNLDTEQQCKLSSEQCMNISNCLLLLRNLLHIPEDMSVVAPNQTGHTVQNQILWNIFSQSFDKVLIKLMVLPEASHWGVTMVQLIAVLYKDQHVVTLHKLLNVWLEASLSESSEDNESNTSPPDRGSEDSSPILTSDPTSDSSDNGGSGKSNNARKSENNDWGHSTTMSSESQTFQQLTKITEMDINSSKSDTVETVANSDSYPEKPKTNTAVQILPKQTKGDKADKKTTISETSDCGYGTQLENQESISTSSNEDELPAGKPVHQKMHNPKQRTNTKARAGTTLQERKRKKIVRRGKTNIINVHGLSHKTPTDDDIANVLKEFTVDFLLKGYNALVQTLHTQILTNLQLEIDKSHFFWLVTYFLKFATQIELDLEHVGSVLSYDIVTYLTAEGVILCEQFELDIKLDGSDLKPSIRRLHLVVTAIREFVQAIEIYKKVTHLSAADQDALVKLQIKMCETEELRSLLVLLLRHYNPRYHTKQYLQDLIVTNHILLLFLENAMKLPGYKTTANMIDHVRQFASPEIMYQYGILLEDYNENGEFVNDCIFTIMHHVGGVLDSLITLFQPKILKTFTTIWQSEFEICDDWSDLIQYVLNTFMKKHCTVENLTNVEFDIESLDNDKIFLKPLPCPLTEMQHDHSEMLFDLQKKNGSAEDTSSDKWTEEEISSLSWKYMQCCSSSDVVSEIVKLFQCDDVIKSRESVIKELHEQNIIDKGIYEKLVRSNSDRSSRASQSTKENGNYETSKLCEQLIHDGKSKFLNWVQEILLDMCYVKIYLEKKSLASQKDEMNTTKDREVFNFEMFKIKPAETPLLSPVSYYSLLSHKSVPLVTWNCEQAAICKDLRFLQLLHKLGFHMPVDSGRVFIRIPQFWTTELLYEVAGKITPIDHSKLKFSINDISNSNIIYPKQETVEMATDLESMAQFKEPDNSYRIQRSKQVTAMINFTPMPGSSFNSNDENKIQEIGTNWLELIQKSQECKLSVNIARIREMDSGQATCTSIMGAPVAPHSDNLFRNFEGTITQIGPISPSLAGPTLSSPSPVLLTCGVVDLKEEKTLFDIHLPESEDDSVCETASVASDLNRMYVSDEDESPDADVVMIAAEPCTSAVKRPPSPSAPAGKRQRVHATPPTTH